MRLLVGLIAVLMLVVSCSSAGSDAADATTSPDPTALPTATSPPAATAAPANPLPTPTALPSEPAAAAARDDRFPTVVAVAASPQGEATWRFDVTLLSEYDSPARYADAWRVLDADDTELGIRILGHDHAGEQPFTRSTTVEIPASISTVFVEARDQLNGWNGERFEVTLG